MRARFMRRASAITADTLALRECVLSAASVADVLAACARPQAQDVRTALGRLAPRELPAVAVSRNFWTKYSEDAVRFWGTKADRAGGQFLQSESFSLKFVP
jgi:hypothetical protein